MTALGGVEGLGFIKTKYSNFSDDYPDFEIHMLTGSPTSDDGQTFRRVQGFTREMWEQVYKPYLPYDTFSLYPVILRPKSRGYIKLRSANPYDPPIIDPKYLTHPDDILSMVDAMKISIAVGLAPAFRQFDSRLFETVYPGCEIYTMWSDEYLACIARTYTSTIYHPVGTARMGSPHDPNSVVDPFLRVLGGVSSLRVVDGSVMPEIVSGNTNAPIIMLAERCADFIKGQQLPPIVLPDSHNIRRTNTVTNYEIVEDIINNLVNEAKKRRRRRRKRRSNRQRKDFKESNLKVNDAQYKLYKLIRQTYNVTNPHFNVTLQ